MKYKTNSPIVFLTYKRPEISKISIDSIKQAYPKKLYIIADGPKNQNEKNLCEKTRKIVEESIDWKCQVIKIYSNKNLGLRKRVVSGLNQVFSKEDQAIIIEDDCVANISFFKFCDQLLKKYEHNQKIYSISGNNFQFGKNKTKYSYYFSKHFHSWGWATWKRAWDKYDDQLGDWEKQKDEKWIYKIFNSKKVATYWKNIFDQVKNEKIDSWAYRWAYAHLSNNGLSIIPSSNLVSNIGAGKGATHTIFKNKRINMPTYPISFPLKHPKKIICFKKADEYAEKTVYANLKNIAIIKLKSILNI